MTQLSEKIIVFLGPTLSRDLAQTILPNATLLPPIQCGDIIKALTQRPTIIAIIDGFFEQCAAVWHKEILLALSEGVCVYGAASMGALRAAELADFGMIGTGKIFDDFHAGRLNDDDEVTILHGPQQTGFEKYSDAMVNIRATLAHATKEKIISQETEAIILEEAKRTFFKERNLLKIIRKLYNNIHELPRCARNNNKTLENHIKTHGLIDQKKEDALELLQIIKNKTSCTPTSFHLEQSLSLRKLIDYVHCEPKFYDLSSIKNKAVARLLRVLAYTIKTAERLCSEPITTEIPSQKLLNQLCSLLKITPSDETKQLLKLIAIYFEKIQGAVSKSGLTLTPEIKPVFKKQLQAHLNTPESVESFIMPFFILTELINRSDDLFLKHEKMIPEKPAMMIALKMLCN